MAALITSLISTFLNIRITIALAFSMTLMILVSLVILIAGSRRANISIEASHLRAFKFDRLELPLRMKSRSARWLQVRILRVKTMDGLGIGETEGPESMRLSLTPRFAGRFKGIGLTLEFGDPLRLFSRTAELSYDSPVIDVLPISLRLPAARISPRMLSTGEVPAGSPGQGQELYSVDAYHGTAETRDILWKRVARSPSQDFFVKVRESNLPETIRVSLVQTVDRGQDRFSWIDLACEGLGKVGNHLLEMGATLRISFSSGGQISTEEVAASDELVAAMMNFSISQPEAGNARQLVLDSDLVIMGIKELENPEVAKLVARKPSLLIFEDAQPPTLLGARSLIFSGEENVAPLILRVMER